MPMSGKRRLSRYPILGGLLVPAVVVVAVWAPIEIPRSITTYGKVWPQRQWILERAADGQLTQMTVDYRTGFREDYSVHEIDRGETLRFRFHPALAWQNRIAQGDTIGAMVSSSTQERLVALQGELDVAVAALQANLTGEKGAVVREYESRLALAKEKAREVQKKHDRMADLFEKQLIAIEDFEAVQSELRLSNIDIALASAQLEVARTGQKAEQIQLLRSEIEGLKREIGTLQDRMGHYTLLAPFDGSVSTFYASDTLLTLSDTRSHLVLCPVKCRDRRRVALGQTVDVRLLGDSNWREGRLVSVKNETQFLMNEFVFVAVVELLDAGQEPPPAGSVARCRIHTEPVRLRKEMGRMLN